ncbi:sigma-70 family RNA polymerase sigma factor [Priestia endophytica]|uniref:sigma-70 family RNA polymerase sigma factor n=1 Tax=Priestia endophytica TaxID=135735 RepID=UPI0022817A5B|nr:sigma-70 family RNA polymerase sigma factor [Priestia endophytica]MCY8235273.1 sigma-70 family RNA polymerase sigma factor [Priestia endophytica]
MQKDRGYYNKQKFQEFLKSNFKLINQPVVKEFLKKGENYSLFIEAVCFPNRRNVEELDQKFKKFYFQVRFIKYLSNLIYYYSIDLDRKYRTYDKYFPLILDKPVQESQNATSLLDFLESYSPDISELILTEEDDLLTYIEDPKLHQVLKTLTDKQRKVLELIYVYDFKNKTIAKLFNESPQNISKIHNNSIKKLKNQLKVY